MNGLPPRVLIVDNDAGLLAAMAVRLESVGCRCVKARSGAQGISELHHGGFDLLLTDLNMPMGDGLALAQAFRRASDAPIVVMTGFIDSFAAELAKIENVTVVEKPFEVHQIVGMVLSDHLHTSEA